MFILMFNLIRYSCIGNVCLIDWLNWEQEKRDLHVFCHARLHCDWPRCWSVVHVWVVDLFLKIQFFIIKEW